MPRKMPASPRRWCEARILLKERMQMSFDETTEQQYFEANWRYTVTVGLLTALALWVFDGLSLIHNFSRIVLGFWAAETVVLLPFLAFLVPAERGWARALLWCLDRRWTLLCTTNLMAVLIFGRLVVSHAVGPTFFYYGPTTPMNLPIATMFCLYYCLVSGLFHIWHALALDVLVIAAIACVVGLGVTPDGSSGEWYTLLCHYLGLTFIAFINGFVNEKRNRSLFHVRDEAKFTARMSHEIRTPLNGVLGMMKELARDPGLSATQRALIDGMEVAANHLLGIVNDILHHMKLRSGQLTLRPQPQRVEAIVSSCIDVFRSKAAAKGLQVGYSVTPGAPAWAMLDELRVRQMLSNLLSNAIKFTASGSVKVAVLPEQVGRREGLRVEVTDTGSGIPVDMQKGLFKPFFQVDPSATRSEEGTGLGLCIVKSFAELMRGTAGCTSAGVGRGSTFWFTLQAPAAEPPAPAAAPAAPPVSLPPELRIMVVDDSPMNLKIMELMINRWGCPNAVLVDRGTKALDYMQATDGARQPHIVFMDLHMPEMGGCETTRKLLARLPDLPVVGLTADLTPETQRACLDVGMKEVLGKPYEESEIKRACFEYGCLQCELQAPEREISGLGPDMVLLPTFVRRASDGVASHRGVPVLTTHSEGDAEGGGGLLGALCSGRQSPGSGSPTTARSGRSEPDLEDTLPGTLPVVRGSRRSRVGSVTNLAGEGQPSAQPGIFLRSDLPGSFTTLDPHPRPSAVYRVSADVGTPLLP